VKIDGWMDDLGLFGYGWCGYASAIGFRTCLKGL